jgi:hypothetical protein
MIAEFSPPEGPAFQAAVAYGRGEYATAIEHLRQLSGSDEASAERGIAGILTTQGKLREAAPYFERGVAGFEAGNRTDVPALRSTKFGKLAGGPWQTSPGRRSWTG